MTHDQETDVSAYPRVVSAVSLYFRDHQKNSDKEYHLQMVEVAQGKFNVDFQYGRRGAKLQSGTKIANTTHGMARYTYGEIYDEKTSHRHKGGPYVEFDFSGLREVYELMVNNRLGAAGANLFMQCGKKMVSMSDYAKVAGPAAVETRDMANAYNANAASRRVMAELSGMGLPDPDVAREVLARVDQLLSRPTNSFRGYSAADLGVFLGHKDGDEVKPGLPQSYWKRFAEDAENSPGDAPAKKLARIAP
jgi:hypothetical protein